MASSSSSVQLAFTTAIGEFKRKLGDPTIYDQILQTTNIEQVYDATDKLQKEQANKGRLRHLSKIEPFLNGLREYDAAINTFVQVKPDVLALIWGPIKLILQWANVLKQSFDAIVDTLEEIGALLPEFLQVASIYKDNDDIHHLMALFFEDILDFYAIAVNFFGLSRLKFVFEMLWPSRKDKIAVVAKHISRHALLMRSKVRLREIQEASDARNRELEHLAMTERNTIKQDFFNLQTHVSPKSYDLDLDRFQGHVYEGTGKWLLRDKAFKDWVDASKPSSRTFWLKGIPGAGKTLLASTVIRHTQVRGYTLFAFLTYKESGITALSVLHSLIFQLASHSDDLKRALSEACQENLKNSLEVSSGLLQALLKCGGTVYIAIDGIDEIDHSERSRLFKELLRLGEACVDCRILFSSRPEADIISALKGKTTDIQVDQRNLESVQMFVDRRMNDWFTEWNFVEQFREEVRHFFSSLAIRAKGMFLYVKVVFGMIESISNIDEIRKELVHLPESLDEAYGRILERINETRPHLKNKARTILGYIGCAPSPLTRQELEQALLIDSNIDNIPRVVSQLDIVRICGPIVEEVDGHVQFVHFTVKQYIFSPSVPGFISRSEMTLKLATCCISYLCRKHHDFDLSDEEMEGYLYSGAYRLHSFASTFWLELVKAYLTLSTAAQLPQCLLIQLRLLQRIRSAEEYKPVDEEEELLPCGIFKSLQAQDKDLAEFLRCIAHFQRTCLKADYHIADSRPWIHLDPLTLLKISLKLRKKFGESIEQTVESRHMLISHYGPNINKCGFLSCKFHRLGFNTASKLSSHEGRHRRPWKCDVRDCEYAKIGFISVKMRDHHLQSNHRSPDHYEARTIYELDDKELQPLLFDLLEAGDLQSAKFLLPHLEKMNWDEGSKIIERLVADGTTSMLYLFFLEIIPELQSWDSWYYGISYATMCTKVIRTHDACLSKIFIASDRLWKPDHMIVLRRLNHIIEALIECENTEVVDIWRLRLIALSGEGLADRCILVSYVSYEVFAATKNMPCREKLLIQLWEDKNVLESLKERYVGYVNDPLVSLSKSCCSITLADYLITRGFPVNGRRSQKYQTPLHHAATQTSKQAAKFMEFLLLKGADPELGTPERSRAGNYIAGKREVEREAGALGITKWLGVSWEQLVERTRKELDENQGVKPANMDESSHGF